MNLAAQVAGWSMSAIGRDANKRNSISSFRYNCRHATRNSISATARSRVATYGTGLVKDENAVPETIRVTTYLMDSVFSVS